MGGAATTTLISLLAALVPPGDVEAMKKWLFAEFGPDMNLANVGVTTIFDTEAQRVGLGPKPNGIAQEHKRRHNAPIR